MIQFWESKPKTFSLFLFFYLILFIYLLSLANGIPFIFDNNESFSSYWHGLNLVNYGFANSFGLADESFSLSKEAHPYAYTHAGTMPRLWSAILYLLGCTSVESQIAITIFTIGIISSYFYFSTISQLSNNIVSFVSLVILITAYVNYTQWHMGNWQIWKLFFLSGSFYLALTIKNYLAIKNFIGLLLFLTLLYYFEHVFNIYITLTSTIFIAIYYKNLKKAFAWFSINFLAGVIAGSILITQVILYVGIESALQDIYLTFIGRNFATDPVSFIRIANSFYEDKNIAFWMNIPDASSIRKLEHLRLFIFSDFNIIGPNILMISATGFFAFILSILSYRLNLSKKIYLKKLQNRKIDTFLAACSLLSLTSFLLMCLDQKYSILWINFPLSGGTDQFRTIFLILIALVFGFVSQNSSKIKNVCWKFRYLLVLYIVLLCSSIIIFYVFTGYVLSGYVSRNAPFVIYAHSIFIGIGFFYIINVAIEIINLRFIFSEKLRIVLFLAVVILPVILWFEAQFFYFKKFHPDNLGFRKAIESTELKNKSIAGNLYGGVPSYFTGSWAYLETEIPNFDLIKKENDIYLNRNYIYLWFADRKSNITYQKPEYYLLYSGYSMDDLIWELNLSQEGKIPERVSRYKIIKLLRNGSIDEFGIKEVGHDPSGADRWSLIKLDWTLLR